AFDINKTPIHWGDNDVQLVLIVSLKEEDRKEFREIFQFFSKAISDETSIRELHKVRNFNDLIQIIYKHN
ncbi:MAG: PTS sugar transporter subunit IIA, partial [Erysipelotrichaceae bacterium]|nr:PTS sugar transporter subunit IIA [Erysipelotrichaceae bacterium]